MTTVDVVAKVTQAHIDTGIPWDGHRCALALAMRETTKDEVAVGMDCVQFGKSLAWLPADAVEFVRRFDNGEPVSPATFLIPVPAFALEEPAHA